MACAETWVVMVSRRGFASVAGSPRAAPGHDIRSPCRAAPGSLLPRGARATSAAFMRPPTLMMGKSGPSSRRSARNTASDFSASGAPLMPPPWRARSSAAKPGTVGAGVGGDHSVEGTVERAAPQAQSRVIWSGVQIRRDLHQQRHAPAVLRLEPLALLDAGVRRCRRVPSAACRSRSPRGIRRRHIDGEIVRHVDRAPAGTQGSRRRRVPAACRRSCRCSRRARRARWRAAGAARRGPRRRLLNPMRLMSARARRTPEQPRPRISRLRPRRDRADFDVAEAQRAQRVEVVAVLVETRGQADRMRKTKAQKSRRRGGRGPMARASKGAASSSRAGQAMRALGRQSLQHRQCHARKHRRRRSRPPAWPQVTFMPASAPLSGESRNTSGPSSPLAHNTMPSETPKRILRGSRLAIMTTWRPMSFAGS